VDAVGFNSQNVEFLDFDLHGLKNDFLVFAGEFVGGDSVNFLGGKWRRNLFDDAAEAGGKGMDLIWVERDWLECGCGLAFGIVGIRGEAEADCAFVSLFGLGVELGEAGEAADDKGQDAGGHGIEGTEVSDGALAEKAAGAGDDIVRGESGGFVDDENGVHGIERLGQLVFNKEASQTRDLFARKMRGRSRGSPRFLAAQKKLARNDIETEHLLRKGTL
jgi:hypothetical protein